MGAPEDGESEITLSVTAYSPKHPEGIESPSVGIHVKPIVNHYPSYLYFVGDHQYWRPETAKGIKHCGKGRYEGFVLLNAGTVGNCGFKMITSRSWGGDMFRMAGFESFNPNREYIFSLGFGDGANIVVPCDLYRIQVDLAEMQLKAAPIQTVSLYGACNGWTDTPLNYDNGNDIWYLHDYALPAGGEGFRIRCNNSGYISLGGDLENLTQDNGSNITVSEAGNYDLTLDLASRPYRLILTKK